MRLTGLIPLHASMTAQNMGRLKFQYRVNQLTFDCLLFIDTQPIELVMGCLGHNFAIYLDISPAPEFAINAFIEPKETFLALIAALKTGNNSGEAFKATAFFSEFNAKIPVVARPDQQPTPTDIVRYYPDIEEAEKIHFCGWLDNTKQGKRVSHRNLAKTRRFFGQRVTEWAERRNQSTRWTHLQDQAKDFFMPDDAK